MFLPLQTAENAEKYAVETCGTALSAGPTLHLKRKQSQESTLHAAGKLQTTHSLIVRDKEQIKTPNTSHLHPDQENKCSAEFLWVCLKKDRTDTNNENHVPVWYRNKYWNTRTEAYSHNVPHAAGLRAELPSTQGEYALCEGFLGSTYLWVKNLPLLCVLVVCIKKVHTKVFLNYLQPLFIDFFF